MRPNLCHSVSISLAAASVLGLAGCAAPDVHPKLRVYGGIILPPDAQVVGLTVTRRCTEFTLQLPETKAGSARSAAAAGAREAASDPYGALLFPVGYVMGGIMGGLFGVSERALKDATQSIETATRALRFDERLVTTLMEHVSIRQPGRIQTLRDNIPMERPGANGYTARGPGGKLTWTGSSHASHPLLGTGIDTVIGVRVGFQGFQPRLNPHVRSTGDVMSFNPPLALVLIADVTVVRVRDWVELGGLTIHYESTPLKFTEWAAGDAQPLRREMEIAMREVFSQIRPLVVCNPPSRT